MRRAVALAAALFLSACATAPRAEALAVLQREPGVHLVLEGGIEAAPGYHLVMGEVVMGPDGVIPRHFHSGEEFLYVMGGSATVIREGEPDLVLQAGQSVRIAPGVVHGGKAGPEGIRGVSSWVVKDGEPLRTVVPD
ncbi:MAG: cupin domain-containing protein [Sphingomonadaceae bacterium]|nr:cupin domain-containing protein [Sphingomonadaceae bacterium]